MVHQVGDIEASYAASGRSQCKKVNQSCFVSSVNKIKRMKIDIFFPCYLLKFL
jgi:hypothetical protein